MVKEVTKVFHQCEICKAEHATDAEAKRCEKRGVKPYDFAKYEVVRYTHVGALLNRLPPSKRLLVVDSPVDEDWAPQHGDVERYSVEWFDKMKLEGGTFHHQRTNMDVRLINMVKARYTKKRCPLCSSTDVASFVKDMYFHQSAVNADTETLRNVETTKCQNCGVIYFTELQRLTMLRSFDEAVSEEKSRKKPTLQGFLAEVIAVGMSLPPKDQNKTA